jgi:hypothetical protein
VNSIENINQKLSRGEVQYQKSPPEICMVEFLNHIINDSFPKEFLVSTIYNKHYSWQLENEYRLTSQKNGKHHHSKAAINRILIGNRASKKLKSDLISLCRDKNIDLYEISPESSTYILKTKKLDIS